MGIINDGLVLYYDAIDNTGNNTHDSSAKTWADLSGNGNNGKLFGGQWGDNYLHFDGNSFVNCGRRNPSQVTVEVLVKFSRTTNSDYEEKVVANTEAGGYDIMNYKGKSACEVNVDGTYYTVYGSTFSVDNKVYLSFTYDNKTIKLFENGTKVNEKSISGTIKSPINSTVLSIGSNPSGESIGNQKFVGDVYSVRLYNRALSDDEILSNYNYDYKRFINLPVYVVKFLIQNEDKYYTISDASLSEVSLTELNAQAFQTYGFDALPDVALIQTLSHPKLLYWQSDDGAELPSITAKVTATPNGQYISKVIDMSNKSITGINAVTVACSGTPWFSCSFDGGVTWKEYSGGTWIEVESYGMTKETLTAITSDEWNEVTSGIDSFIMRVLLRSSSDILTNLSVNFLNKTT